MDSNGTAGNGNISDLPWASVFDPAANARALSAIQAEGFRAASQILDRFVGMATNAANGAESASTNGDGGLGRNGTASPPVVSALEQLTRAWWSTIGQLLLLRPAPGGTPALDTAAALDLSNADASGQVCFEAPGPARATTELWLHNRGQADLGQIQLRCSDLMTHDDHRIASDAVQFDPEIVPMPARSSRGVTMTIAVASEISPGLYRGMVLVNGHPDLWLPVAFTSSPVA